MLILINNKNEPRIAVYLNIVNQKITFLYTSNQQNSSLRRSLFKIHARIQSKSTNTRQLHSFGLTNNVNAVESTRFIPIRKLLK